ncbi:MAG: 5-deoxy-glucuronate isomerase [Chloroflexi bacterium]|nr:5-deoxy-glucuronate isomerase [Chloroflexota bacterium]
MKTVHIKGKEFEFGYNEITRQGGDPDMLMDFGILRLKKNQEYVDDSKLEKAYLLVYGWVKLIYDEQEVEIKRENCFDVGCYVLHLPANTSVKIIGLAEDTELTVNRTTNEREFVPRLYTPEDSPDEYRGAGTMQETSTRIVRTVFDYTNAPYANLVIGEVIGFPGKWSSYPPHHHPQPEIYYYKTNPAGGHALAQIGEEAYKLSDNDTILIHAGQTHPHVTYPGYALWYLWVIRHLDGKPYGIQTFEPQYQWVTDPNAKFWPDNK